mmetsp:Transcript_62560/g.116331  ORF Transcript_62560/g.116331 Transcript_62560/m.116331 type:complete len:229 (-) Transcript_62560:160-846(-)
MDASAAPFVPMLPMLLESEMPKTTTENASFRRGVRKTRMCRFYAQGRCFYGSSECSFAHSPDELRSTPNLSKTSLCVKWCRGSCPLSSEECRYAHGCEELRRTNALVSKNNKVSDVSSVSPPSSASSNRVLAKRDSIAFSSSAVSTTEGSVCDPSEIETLSCGADGEEHDLPSDESCFKRSISGASSQVDKLLLCLAEGGDVLPPPPGLEQFGPHDMSLPMYIPLIGM